MERVYRILNHAVDAVDDDDAPRRAVDTHRKRTIFV